MNTSVKKLMILALSFGLYTSYTVAIELFL